MRTERDVRENPVAGDVVRLRWVRHHTVQAAIGNLVAITADVDPWASWVTREFWSELLTADGSAVLHIAQPGGDA